MAFVWIQQWVALPIIIEDPMGDIPPGSGPQSLDVAAAGLAQGEHQSASIQASSPQKPPSNNTPFYSQLSSIPQQQPRPDLRSPTHPANPHYTPQDHGATPLNMGAMSSALPEYTLVDGAPPHHVQRQFSGASTPALVYQLQQNLQMHGHGSSPLPAQPAYGPGFGTGQFQQNYIPPQAAGHATYGAFPAVQQRVPGPNSMHPSYQAYPPPPSPYMYYPGAYAPQATYAQGFAGQNAPGQQAYGRRPSIPSPYAAVSGPDGDMPQSDGMFANAHRVGPPTMQGDPNASGNMFGGQFVQPTGKSLTPSKLHDHRTKNFLNDRVLTNAILGIPRSGPVSSIPRGPPRKPKQSGHALWVGNLPPGTTVAALKDHFSRDATRDIESLFLISKSNCAFVNYRTDASCTAAMHRFHDSRFNGVRLVCRLRRSSAPATGIPTGPSAMVGGQVPTTSPPKSPQEVEDGKTVAEGDATNRTTTEDAVGLSNASDKYFIVKSLTLQDLELSVRNGIWATQSHNEETLNKAYEARHSQRQHAVHIC